MPRDGPSDLNIVEVDPTKKLKQITLATPPWVDVDALLKEELSDEDLIAKLCQAVVADDPSDELLAKALELVQSSDDRRESLQHLTWALVHTTQHGMTHGIYQLDDDTLTLCLAPPGTDRSRPKQLAVEKGAGTVLLKLKRRAK